MNSVVVEVLWLFGFDTDKISNNNSEDNFAKIFSNIVNSLIKKKIINLSDLIEKFEEKSLLDCGLIPDKDTFRKKITRLNTKITYEQQKFNLLREDSEGFAKLIFLLFEIHFTSVNVQKYIDKIQSLIGFFDLDPNRVLDIVLSAFENDPFNENFIKIISLFNINALPHILGFRFTNIKEQSDNIFVVAAQLIKHKLITFLSILPHLTPSLKETEDEFNSYIARTNTYYQGLSAKVAKYISLGSAVPIRSNNNNNNDNNSDNINNSNFFVNFNDIIAENNPQLNENQIYKLLFGLSQIHDWNNFEKLHSLMENYYNPLGFDPLIDSICNYINWVIKPLYKNLSFRQYFQKKESNRKNSLAYESLKDNKNIIIDTSTLNHEQIVSPEEFIVRLPKILKFLTVGLSRNLITFTKLIRIIKQNIKFFTNSENIGILTDIIIKVFLPSICIIDPTAVLLSDLWAVFAELDYSRRCKIYNYWLNNLYTTHPILYLKYGVTLKEAAKWQKTLSKENTKQWGRILGVLTNSNPILVFDNIIKFLTSYDNQINIFMQSLSFSSELSYDVITFIIGKICGENRIKINSEMGEIASWFKFFAYFVGSFYKKYYNTELSNIIYYCTSKIKLNASNTIDLYIIREIIEQMSGIKIMEDMGEAQVQACAGGLYLFLETNDLMKEYKYLKKPINALLKFFTSNSNQSMNTLNYSNEESNGVLNSLNLNSGLSFTAALLILLGIRRQPIIYNCGYNQTKLMGALYDQVQNTYIQLVQFLRMHSDKETYRNLIPNWKLETYIINYKCQPEILFFLIRNSIKPLYELNDSEYNDYILQFTKALDTNHSINYEHFNSEFEPSYLEKSNFLGDIYKNIWEYITPELYFIFSSLKLTDVYVPKQSYEQQIEKNKKEIENLQEDSKNSNDNYNSKNKKEIDRCNNNIENLKKEMSLMTKNKELIHQFVEEKKLTLLKDIHKNNKKEFSVYLIQVTNIFIILSIVYTQD